MTEISLHSIATYFFVLEYEEENISNKTDGLQTTLLGWSLLLAWIDLSILLARFDQFGKNIYMTWNIVKNTFWPIVVYLPTLVAFGSAFHCFLCHNPVFEGSTSSMIRVLTMMIGEYDFENSFLFDNVKENKDSRASVQVTFPI